MDVIYAGIAVSLFVLLIFAGMRLEARKRAAANLAPSTPHPQSQSTTENFSAAALQMREEPAQQPEPASRIVVMTSSSQPAFELAMISDDIEFNRGRPLAGKGGLKAMNRLSACLQAAPGLMVQQAHQGRRLMEVLISNPLANAADGIHLRPYAVGPDGKFLEQAKLLDPAGLGSLVNAAAVWQVASVVVAKKHLADISAKLDDIKQGIDDLKGFNEDTLDGDVVGTYQYLQGVAETFERGEVPKFARLELESCRHGLCR